MTARSIALDDGGELWLDEAWLSPSEASGLLDGLMREIPWEQREIVIMGRRILQPRMVAWIGDSEAVYTYSGVTNMPVPWTPRLAELRDRVESAAGARFNSVLANLYRDEHDSMGMHADNEKELGPDPVIASLSLGATRRFQLRHAKKKSVAGRDFELGSGALLIMRGATQRLYRHGVPKEREPRGPRLNLTFREIKRSP